MSLHQLRTGSPTPTTAVEFFRTICPKVLTLHATICKQLGGLYAFQLFGEGGGAWTLDYPACVVRDGALDDADLYVEMEARDFADLLRGTLDVDRAAEEGRIRINGDASLFTNLAAVLEPTGGA